MANIKKFILLWMVRVTTKLVLWRSRLMLATLSDITFLHIAQI